MAELIVVYWRDIPAQVIAKRGRTAAKRQLSERFMQRPIQRRREVPFLTTVGVDLDEDPVRSALDPDALVEPEFGSFGGSR